MASNTELEQHRRSALRYVQLLSPAPALRDTTSARPVRKDSRSSARAAWVPVDRLCGHAGARSLAPDGAAQRKSIEGAASVETKGFRGAAQEEKKAFTKPTDSAISRNANRRGAFLAAAFL